LGDSFAWLGTPSALTMLSVAAIVEILAYCIPGLALLWQILSGRGFPNQYFCDSWVVGFWRGRLWLAGHWTGETSLDVG
jgi:hypothetical protein